MVNIYHRWIRFGHYIMLGPEWVMLLYNCTGWVLDIAPRTNETLSDFFIKFWILVNGTQRCGIQLHDIQGFRMLIGDQQTPKF